MNISFWTESFEAWYDKLWAWVNEDPQIRPEQPPVTLNDLPDQGGLTTAELGNTTSDEDYRCFLTVPS